MSPDDFAAANRSPLPHGSYVFFSNPGLHSKSAYFRWIPEPSDLDDELLAEAGTGDRSAIGRLLERHRGRLRNSLARRIDRRLSARLDASDLVQETFAVAGRRLPEFFEERRIGFFEWLRGLAMDRLISSRRFHLGASKRTAVKELPQAHRERDPVAGRAFYTGASPSGLAIHNEDSARIRSILDRMQESDREILDLRYVEGLTFAQLSARLGITQSCCREDAPPSARCREAARRIWNLNVSKATSDERGRPARRDAAH